MTTAHRPTFDPARGKEIQRVPAYHQRLLPAHTKLKVRQPGQGGDADKSQYRDLRVELLKAEAEHFAKTKGTKGAVNGQSNASDNSGRKRLKTEEEEAEAMDKEGEDNGEAGDSPEAKRRRILASTRDLDADSDSDHKSSSSDDDDSYDDDDDEDETAELLRELEKIKRERAEAREREEHEKAAKAEHDKMISIAKGNPLLNPDAFSIKRRWDDDVIFKNQARGTDDRNKKKEFVNDLLRSDFHKKFMTKYVR